MAKVLNDNRLQYTGKIQPKIEENERDKDGQLLYPYLPDENLVEAVNLTIQLKRPLLLKGEPGCGKTRLARAVAYELELPYEAWYIKSTGRAQDGLYTYDTVGRLRDAQLAPTGRISEEKITRMDDPFTYVQWGPLGKAFRNDQRTVLLIDEIDKADIDFPNDLLRELDELWFEVNEAEVSQSEKKIYANAVPIVFITSNDEKDLPDAFLRRCLFHYIEFPNRERLIMIVKAYFPHSAEMLLEAIIDRFLELRDAMRKDKRDIGKLVSTSELIDWVAILLSRFPDDEILKRLSKELLCPGVLLKSWDDYRRYVPKFHAEVLQ